ncbi:hypothetical protein MSTO_32800 [Mycobacterium stomatepiae]|uniref:Beta-lactamase-related domain-containing protein n=1 Tax=Mycobacterium stomatepiae TaxID=470076 RepID=A0A7I7Q9T6_9MYCO|nr:hypothetical protein MSTO_32800 [Mycobacterium stomatepiae]
MGTRRRIASLVLAGLLAAACGPTPTPAPPQTGSADKTKADAVLRVVHNFMTQAHLKAVIVRVTVDGKEVVTQAVGDSMTGVPATPDMHFRNGAVAISYVSTLLLKLVDQKKLEPRGPAVEMAARLPQRRARHAGTTGADDVRLPGLHPRQRSVRQ